MKRKDISIKGYTSIRNDIISLLDQARHISARTVNVVMTAVYWNIGRRIIEFEQYGASRAKYGGALLSKLSEDLNGRFSRGFSVDNLETMRLFYLAYPVNQKSETVSRKSKKSKIMSSNLDFSALATRFPLPWSHYVLLLRRVKQAIARDFYEAEAIRGGWTVRQLDRQIETQFFERTALSVNKKSMLIKGNKRQSNDHVSIEEEIKDPFVLEFLGLKDEYSESELEEALIHHLENFLLELGADFAFIGRQRRLRVGNEWYRVDLLFFHRKLRCLVIIDLKIGRFTHADAGQMHLYINYAKEHWMREGENPPVGLILCASRDTAVAHYALEGLSSRDMAAEYMTTLPKEKTIAEKLNKARDLIEKNRSKPRRSRLDRD